MEEYEDIIVDFAESKTAAAQIDQYRTEIDKPKFKRLFTVKSTDLAQHYTVPKEGVPSGKFCLQKSQGDCIILVFGRNFSEEEE